MKILLISSLPPPSGGISTWTKIYIDQIRKFGHSVDLINTALTGKRAKKINSKRSIIDEIFRTLKIFKSLVKYLQDNIPDLVHINSSCSKFGIIRDYLVIKLIKRLKIPIVLHLHCNAADQLNNKISRIFFSLAVTSVNKVLVLNHETNEFVNNICYVNSEVVPNFISEEWILKGEKAIRENIERIIFVGHVQKEKGVEDIFEVAKFFPDIQFVLAGPVKCDYSKIISNNVKLVGTVNLNQVQNLLDSSDIFLFPTRSEGFSMALTEAMARGLPIITTRVGANLDMIEENGGEVVSQGNIKEIILSIERLKSIDKRTMISRWNINKVRNSYTTQKVMRNLLNVYAEVKKQNI